MLKYFKNRINKKKKFFFLWTTINFLKILIIIIIIIVIIDIIINRYNYNNYNRYNNNNYNNYNNKVYIQNFDTIISVLYLNFKVIFFLKKK